MYTNYLCKFIIQYAQYEHKSIHLFHLIFIWIVVHNQINHYSNLCAQKLNINYKNIHNLETN